jgi:hypothetical protein
MSELFLAWRDPHNRGWYVVGRLTYADEFYEFVYTRGMLTAATEAGFQPLPSFPDASFRYRSTGLFPLFANRLPPRSRPDYSDFVQYLNFVESELDPIAILGLSGGRRVTDTFEMFRMPERDTSGMCHIRFFVHGLGHLSAESHARADRLNAGERLLLMHDFQNPADSRALLLRTAEAVKGDVYPVGYCPRYLLDDLYTLFQEQTTAPEVRVERINLAPAPVSFRVLCSLTARWPWTYEPFSGDQYQPLGYDLPERFIASDAYRSSSPSFDARY